jgi:hypothetical protein
MATALDSTSRLLRTRAAASTYIGPATSSRTRGTRSLSAAGYPASLCSAFPAHSPRSNGRRAVLCVDRQRLHSLLSPTDAAACATDARQGRTWRKMTLFRTADPAPHKVAHALLLLAAEAVNLLRRLIVEVRLEFQKVRARCQQRCRRPGRGTGNARGHGLLRPRSAALPSSQSHSRRPGAAACCLRDGKADRGSVGRLSAEGLGWAPRPAQRTGSRARAKHTHPVLRVEPGALPILAAGQEQAHESVAPRRRRPVER